MMRKTGHWRLWITVGATTVALLTGASGLAPAASAVPKAVNQAGRATAAAAAGPVSPKPASGTPHLVKKTTALNVIRQIVQCGNIMYAVGSFREIIWNGHTYARHDVFSFKATAPYAITSWNPGTNGEVNSIALSRDCSHAYIGGDFTSVHGTAADHLANVRTSTGTVVLAWAHRANNSVNTMLLTPNGHLLAGGKFTTINGSTNHRYLASLDPSTGAPQRYLTLNISGSYHFCGGGRCSGRVWTQVYNQQLSHSGTLVLEEGVFTSVGGKARQQIFMLNLGASRAAVTGWTSPEWDGSKGNLPGGYPYECWYDESFYVRSAAWSANDSSIYLATTGFHPWNQPTGTSPRTGLCDATSAFPAVHTSVRHLWINYTGCDSLYVAAADPSAVYVGGHPRWLDNSHGCNHAGTGAVSYHGMQAMHPGTGTPLLNSSGKALYGMSRANADDMLVTKAGLWIASTNRYGSDWCNDVSGHAGICFLPYRVR